MSGDYLLICNGKAPLIKARAKKAHNKFIEQMQGLFGGEEELIEAIGKDSLIQSLSDKRNALINLKDGLTCVYQVKDNVRGKIEALDKLKATYRKIYFDYPSSVDSNADLNTQKEQTDKVIKPIESEILRLEYKIKELSPKKEKSTENKKPVGLELHILFTQQVLEMAMFDRNMSVHSFSIIYDQAIKKNEKLKAQQNG